MDESLRQDYANLEVPFGSDIDTVRRSYKALMLKYHPDKHGGNAQEQKIALEITKKINESFERIRARNEGGSHFELTRLPGHHILLRKWKLP